MKAAKVTEVRISAQLMRRNVELEEMLAAAREALARLAEVRLEDVSLRDHAVAQHDIDVDNWYEDGDGDAPFFTEAYLYPMFGKEAARTVLAAVRGVQRALGLPPEGRA